MEFLKEKAKDIPGLTIVIAVCAFLLVTEDASIPDAFFLFVLSWVFYECGSPLDGLFDWIYKPRIARKGLRNLPPGVKTLDACRDTAAWAIQRPITGIYGKAKDLF